MRTQGIFAFVAIYVGLVDSFYWDIVIARDNNKLEFYKEGKLVRSETTASGYISWVTYDPVHKRVLFADTSRLAYCSVSSYELESEKTQCLIKKKSGRDILLFTYDPPTEFLFGSVNNSIYSFLLKPGNYKEANGDLVLYFDEDDWVTNIAVDSCGGYIYRSIYEYRDADIKLIQRIKLNGAQIEVIRDSIRWIDSFIVDQQAQKMYWIENDFLSSYNGFSIISADLDGKNRTTLYTENKTGFMADELTVSKDFIFWEDRIKNSFFKLSKYSPRDADVKPEKIQMIRSIISRNGPQDMAAYYEIKEQTQGIQNCTALKRLIPNYAETYDLNASTDASLFCVNGTKVNGESLCECKPGYIGARCDVSVCQNYCIQGDCNVSTEGQPKCRCNAGYSGERCEVHACHKYCLNNGVCSLNEEDEAMCQCTDDYEGERCDVPFCKDYCFQGNCSVSAEGQPICSCNAGYSGERCEVNACHGYCLNNGVCSLNEEDELVCRCTEDYKGERCDVPAFLFNSILRAYKDVMPVTLDSGAESTCASTVV